MAKYIDADKLIAEIGKLTNQKKKQLERFSDEDYCCSVASSINCELSGNLEVLSIIKSIQQEQPEVDWQKELPPMTDDEVLGVCICDQFGNHRMMTKDVREIARHSYELGLNARKEE